MAVAASAPVLRGGVQGGGEDVAVTGAAAGVLGGGAFGGLAGGGEQVPATLDAPEPQHLAGVPGPEGGPGRALAVLGGAAQELDGVHQVLDHALLLVPPGEGGGGREDGVVGAVGGGRGVGVVQGDGHEALQHVGGDLGEGLRDGGGVLVAGLAGLGAGARPGRAGRPVAGSGPVAVERPSWA